MQTEYLLTTQCYQIRFVKHSSFINQNINLDPKCWIQEPQRINTEERNSFDPTKWLTSKCSHTWKHQSEPENGKTGKMNSQPHLAENIGHILSLPLCPLVGTQLSLCHLESTLVLTYLQKLSDPLLIWSKTRNFPDKTSHEVHPLASFLQTKTTNP